jgi:dinuclear metal center YbgI/SA1388 family protein
MQPRGVVVLVADLQSVLEKLAPSSLAQPGDNIGLLVGDGRAAVRRVLLALELTGPVLDEALAGGCDTVLTHHPFLFSPVRSLVESRPRERLLRRLVAEHMTLIACHTNLDAAPGGLAEIAGEALGLRDMSPLEPASAGWYKLVGFVPAEAVESVADAVFSAGVGGIGNYRECAFATDGTGWFTALPGAHPAVGQVAKPQRTPEVRWETVVPRSRLADAVQAFVRAHPYEEPAFDIYPIEDVLPGAGLGRVGELARPLSVAALAELAGEAFEVGGVPYSGDGSRMVTRVGVLPGSGRSAIDTAAGRCEVLITGDVGYHAADQAAEGALSLIDVPHGDFEWWAFRRWSQRLENELAGSGVSLSISQAWASLWKGVGHGARRVATGARGVAKGKEERVAGASVGEPGGYGARAERVRIWIDGGSRGNPGPSATGVVIEDPAGAVVAAVGKAIGIVTNNVAEYRALLAGLEMARELGAPEVEVASDSELLVKQMRGEYKVKNEGLKPLHQEARDRAAAFRSFTIRHIDREDNTRADALVNRALDEQEKAGL